MTFEDFSCQVFNWGDSSLRFSKPRSLVIIAIHHLKSGQVPPGHAQARLLTAGLSLQQLKLLAECQGFMLLITDRTCWVLLSVCEPQCKWCKHMTVCSNKWRALIASPPTMEPSPDKCTWCSHRWSTRLCSCVRCRCGCRRHCECRCGCWSACSHLSVKKLKGKQNTCSILVTGFFSYQQKLTLWESGWR